MRGKQPVLRLREMSDGPCGQVASAAGPRRALLGLGLCLVTTFALGSCTPYERQSGEYLAGSVDPIKFPAAYLGQDGDAKKPGAGTFRYQTAMVRGTKIAYYPLPMTGAQASAPDPLDVNRLRLPLAYIFDPQAGPSPRDSQSCIRPEDYKFDRYQGSACKKDIATVLPRLQSVYGIQLSNDRVLWENPDDMDADARPQPGMTKEK